MEGLTPFFTMKNMEGLTRYQQIVGYVLKDGTKAPRLASWSRKVPNTQVGISFQENMYQLCLQENDVAWVFNWTKNCQDTWGECQKNHDEKRGWEMPILAGQPLPIWTISA